MLNNKKATIHIPVLVFLTLILVAYSLFVFVQARAGTPSKIIEIDKIQGAYNDFSKMDSLFRDVARESFIETQNKISEVNSNDFRNSFMELYKKNIASVSKQLELDETIPNQINLIQPENLKINSVNNHGTLSMDFSMTYFKFFTITSGVSSVSYNKPLHFEIDF